MEEKNQSQDLIRFRQGDRDAFRFFYEKYSPAICHFISRSIDDTPEAEDIMHDVFINLWNSRETIESEYHLSMFIYRSARHRCINNWRRKKTDNKYRQNFADLSSDEDYFAAVLEEEVHRMIYEEIQQLPGEQKNVIMLHLEGKDNYEIAEILQISVNTVKTHKARARRTLRQNLDHLFIYLAFLNL